MNRKQKTLLTASIFIVVLCCVPVVGAITVDQDVAALDYFASTHAPLGRANYQLIFTATGPVDVFVTGNAAHITSYDSTGVIPVGVIAGHTGTSGTLDITYPDPDSTYLYVLGNRNGMSLVTVTYEFKPAGIPGFGILFVFLALLAAFGILWSKKQLNF